VFAAVLAALVAASVYVVGFVSVAVASEDVSVGWELVPSVAEVVGFASLASAIVADGRVVVRGDGTKAVLKELWYEKYSHFLEGS